MGFNRQYSIIVEMTMILRHTYLILTAVLILSLCGIVSGQDRPFSVKAEIDRQSAYVGDKLEFGLTIVTDSATSFDSIPIGETLGEFEVKERKSSLSTKDSITLTHRINYVIAAYKTGQLWIPAIPVHFVRDDSVIAGMTTDSLSVTILSVASGDSLVDIKGLKPPIYFGRKFPWIYVIIAVVVLAILFGWLYKRRRKSEALVKREPVDMRPPWIIAEEKLKRLRESDLFENKEFKLFYLGLTEILRSYIESRYGVDALDRTTSELRAVLSTVSLDQGHLDMFFELFDDADLVKFAKFQPTVAQAEADFQKGWKFVQDTGEKRPVGVRG